MAVAHVQTTKTIVSGGGSATTTSSISLTGGNLLLIGITSYLSTGTPSISNVKLDNVTAFTVDQSANANAGGADHVFCAIASLANVAGGSHTVTVNWAAAVTNATLYLTEVSGAATSSYQDGAGATASGGPATNPSTGAFTTGASTDFWYSCLTNFSGANPATVTGGTSWTIPTNGKETNGVSNLVGGVEYQANPGSTSMNGTWTTDNDNYAVVAMAYKVAPAGGGTVALEWQSPQGDPIPQGWQPGRISFYQGLLATPWTESRPTFQYNTFDWFGIETDVIIS